MIGTGAFWFWRYRKFKVAARHQRPFRYLPVAGKTFIAGAGVFLAAAIMLQFVETGGQQDSALVFGTYSSDMALIRALLLFFLQILLGVIFLFLPVMLRFNYSKIIAFIFWAVTFVTLTLLYFGLPIFELAKVSGVIETGLLSPTTPSWMRFVPVGIYVSLATFTALIVEALVARRPIKYKFATAIAEAFE